MFIVLAIGCFLFSAFMPLDLKNISSIVAAHTIQTFFPALINFLKYFRYDGRALLKPTVPDTITSWVITGFSVDPVYGLGLVEAPTKVKVFRQFFVSLDLPYSVIRGEVVSIPIVVFNYFTEDLTAEVTLKNDGEFEFTDVSNDVNETPSKSSLSPPQINFTNH